MMSLLFEEVIDMKNKQSQYTITYDDFNDSFLCVINGETISAKFV